MNTPLPQSEVKAILGGKCFIRKAAEDFALFVTDAPRRMPDTQLKALSDQLAGQGFRQWTTERGLWAIDLDEQRWFFLLKPFEHTVPCSIPEDGRLLDVYALMRLLKAHPAPLDGQPREPIRAILKRFDQPEEFIRIAPVLLQDSAKRLREHQPLPYAATGILCVWLNEFTKEVRQ